MIGPNPITAVPTAAMSRGSSACADFVRGVNPVAFLSHVGGMALP
jgi:hypothetical protein